MSATTYLTSILIPLNLSSLDVNFDIHACDNFKDFKILLTFFFLLQHFSITDILQPNQKMRSFTNWVTTSREREMVDSILFIIE